MGARCEGVDKKMSQTSIQETLQTILSQLHESDSRIELNKRQNKTLTAMEVAQILADQGANNEENSQDQGEKRISQPSVFIIDREQLEQELREANAQCQIHYYRPIYSCRRWLGQIIVFGKKTVRKLLKFLIEPIIEEQNRFNSATTRALNAIRNHHVVFQAGLDYLSGETKKQEQSLEDMREGIREELQIITSDTKNELEDLRNELKEAIKLLRKASYMQKTGNALGSLQEEEDIYDKIDYFKFQQFMRGSCAEIKERQKVYLSYFTSCEHVIDLGCGRGEFLEALQDHGIGAVGVDNYIKSVEYCRMKGLQVACGDVIQFLCDQKENSVDGVFSAQLIEHISAGKILELCRESYRIMKPDSYIVLETPNPMCLSIFMNSFYLDPSHKNPVHPHLMEYFMQECGFRNIKIVYTNESKINYRFPLLNVENSGNLEEFNDGINFLSDIMFGSQDYAIVAQK